MLCLKVNNMNYLLFALLLSTVNNVKAQDCLDWFSDLKLTKDQDCVLNCMAAPTGMGTFMCTKKCNELCKKEKPNNKTKMTLSKKGIEFISSHEQFKEIKYRDVGGNETIGYGHLILDGEKYPKPITKEDATKLLEKDIKFAISAVNEAVTVPLKQNEFDALVSLTFNIGIGAFKSSTILKIINSGKPIAIDDFKVWNKVNGQTNQGLSIRRQDEFKLYEKEDYEAAKKGGE